MHVFSSVQILTGTGFKNILQMLVRIIGINCKVKYTKLYQIRKNRCRRAFFDIDILAVGFTLNKILFFARHLKNMLAQFCSQPIELITR